MNDDILLVLIIVGVLAYTAFIIFAGIYTIKQNKAVNELKMPPDVDQIRRKSRRKTFVILVIFFILIYLFVFLC